MLEIEARRWLAVWYKCPRCGSQTAHLRMTPTRQHREYRPVCLGYKCERCPVEVVEMRHYTTFCIEPSISFTTVAGTLEKIGPFHVCDIVHPNIRVFRRWVRQRQAEVAEQARQYFEHEKRIQAEAAARREREQAQAALIKEAGRIAWRRAHATELAAEAVAREAWPQEEVPAPQLSDDDLGDLDEAPF